MIGQQVPIPKETTYDPVLIEEFFNLSDEETKIVNYVRDEFDDLKFFNYGCLIYMQNENDLNSFPHISELLENYEKTFAEVCYTGHLVIRMTKCKENNFYV
jgi:hypothetical protein